MSNQYNQNRSFETDVLKILTELRREQEKQGATLINKVEILENKVDTIERKNAEYEKRLSDVETEDKIQRKDLESSNEKISGINTLIRWVGLLVVGAVIVALMNLVIINNGNNNIPPALPTPTTNAAYVSNIESDNRDARTRLID